MPSSDQGQTVLEHVRVDDRGQQPPRTALVDPSDRIGEGAWQQGKQQFVAYLPIPTNAHVAITCGVVALLGDAGNGPAVLGRPEVAVQDDLPGWRGTHAFNDRAGTRLRIVIQWEEFGPAKPCSRDLGIQGAGPQHGDCGVSERLPRHRGVEAVSPLRNLRPVGLRPELPQAFAAAGLDSHNGPPRLVGGNLAPEGPVGKFPVVVPISSHPSRRLPSYAHLLHAVVQMLRPCRAARFDGLKMSALRQQQHGGSRAAEPSAEIVRLREAFPQPVWETRRASI